MTILCLTVVVTVMVTVMRVHEAYDNCSRVGFLYCMWLKLVRMYVRCVTYYIKLNYTYDSGTHCASKPFKQSTVRRIETYTLVRNTG